MAKKKMMEGKRKDWRYSLLLRVFGITSPTLVNVLEEKSMIGCRLSSLSVMFLVLG